MSGFVCDVKQVISLDWVLGYNRKLSFQVKILITHFW